MTVARERLEQEVRLTARRHKRIFLVMGDGTEKEVFLRALSFDDFDEIGGEIAALFAHVMRISTAAQAAYKGASREDELSHARLGAGEESTGDGVDPPASGERVAEDDFAEVLFDPVNIKAIGVKARDLIKALIRAGAFMKDKDVWDELKAEDFQLSIALGIQILRYNVGPELRDFLAGELKGIGEIFGVKMKPKAKAAGITESKPSSSDADTPSTPSSGSPSAKPSAE